MSAIARSGPVEDYRGPSFVELPVDATGRIFEFLDVEALGEADSVCRAWHLAQGKEFWEEAKRQRFSGVQWGVDLPAREFVRLHSRDVFLIGEHKTEDGLITTRHELGYMNVLGQIITLIPSSWPESVWSDWNQRVAAADIAMRDPRVPNNSLTFIRDVNRGAVDACMKDRNGRIKGVGNLFEMSWGSGLRCPLVLSHVGMMFAKMYGINEQMIYFRMRGDCFQVNGYTNYLSEADEAHCLQLIRDEARAGYPTLTNLRM